MRIPGEAASVVTCIDGYEMARQGRAGPALMIAALGSFIGGTFSILGLMFIAPPLAKVQWDRSNFPLGVSNFARLVEEIG